MSSEDTDRGSAFFGIDWEADEAETIARKLGAEYPCRKKTHTLTEDALRYVNLKDENGNTALMKLVTLDKSDCVDFLSGCECVDLEAENEEYETAAVVAWKKKRYACLLALLRNDSKFPYNIDFVELEKEGELEVEKKGSGSGDEGQKVGAKDLSEFVRTRKSLHECIKNGDLKGVKEATYRQDSSYYYYVENKTALRVAAEICEREMVKKDNLEIYVFLMYVGCTYASGEERVKFHPTQKNKLEALRNEYFTEGKDWHLDKLMSSVKVFGRFTDEMKAVVRDMFQSLNRSKEIKIVMKTIANEHVDVVFHFASDQTDLLHDESGWGLADHNLRRVYIAAKNCLPYKGIVDKKVAGTLAHELCHITMQILYKNDAKPYSKGDTSERVFAGIVTEMKKNIELSPSDDSDSRSVIKRVFEYRMEKWHVEMIVRVVQLLAMYGDRRGKEILKSFSEPLLSYFNNKIILDCKSHYKDMFYRKPLTKYWNQYREFVHAIEEGMIRLKTPRKLPEMHPYGHLNILVTSSVEMSCIDVYQCLKETYVFHLNKCCLFIELSHFLKQHENIIAAFNSKACKYLVLKTKDEELENDLVKISLYFEDVLFEENKKVILIVDSENNLPQGLKENVVKYVWDDLSESSKEYMMSRKVNFQGIAMELGKLVDEKLASNNFHMEELSCLINEKTVMIGKDKHMMSLGYDQEFYITRLFVAEMFDELIHERSSEDCILFVTGISEQMLQDMGIDQEELHVIYFEDKFEDDKNLISEGKGIYIPQYEDFSEEAFKIIIKKNINQFPLIWLHYFLGNFFLKKINHCSREIEKLFVKKTVSEDDLIEISVQNEKRVILISDDTGTGKSTVMTEIIRKLKKKQENSWVIRFDFNEYADDEDNPLSLKHINDECTPDEIINQFIVMIGLENKLEVTIFKEHLKLPFKVSIVFDGFDEVSTYYRENVFSLFRVLEELTKARIWVTTRKHDGEMLETHFNTISFRLEIIALTKQVEFLTKYWKKELKFPRFELRERNTGDILKIQAKLKEILLQMKDTVNVREELKNSKSIQIMIETIEEIISSNEELEMLRLQIDKLDFTDYAHVLLLEMDIDCVAYENQFTTFPLHLFMFADMSYHENLKVGIFTDIFDMYSKFINKKLEIFAKEKCRNVQDTQGNKNQFKILKEQYTEEHQKIAVQIIQPKNFEWNTLECKKSVLEFIHDIGILYIAEKNYHFVHRSFAEYYFSDWLCKIIKSNDLKGELLEEILSEDRYGVILRFLSCKFKEMGEEIKFNDTLLDELNVKAAFIEFIEQYFENDIKVITPIWKNIFEYSAKNRGSEYFTDLFFQSSFSMDEYLTEDKKKIIVFQLLKDCLSAELLIQFLDVLDENGYTRIIPWITVGSCGIVSSLMEMIQKIAESDSHCGEASRILLQTDEEGYTLLHRAAGNQDPGVFRAVTSCIKHVLGEDLFMKQITKRNKYNATFINSCIFRKRSKTISAILQDLNSILKPEMYKDLLLEEDVYNHNVLRIAIRFGTDEVFDSIATNLIDIFGFDAFLQMLVARDSEKNTMLHSCAQSCDVDIFSQVLLIARSYMNDEAFREFVMSQNERKETILHEQASQEFSNCTFSFLQTLKSYIGNEKLRDLFMIVDEDGNNCLHSMCSKKCWPIFREDAVINMKRFLGSDMFAQIALMTNNNGDTFLHTSAKNKYFVMDSFFEYLDDLLGNSLLRKLFQMKNNDGVTILEILSEKDDFIYSSVCFKILKFLRT